MNRFFSECVTLRIEVGERKRVILRVSKWRDEFGAERCEVGLLAGREVLEFVYS